MQTKIAQSTEYLLVLSSMTRTKPSRPIGAPGESSKVCVTDRPTDTTGYRSALTHQKIPEKEAFETCYLKQTIKTSDKTCANSFTTA